MVIGSGIGGSAAAAMLAHAGIRTTLLEKNRRIGGSCAGYEKQGFKIDIGTHMFCRGPVGPLGDVLERLGEAGAIEFRQTPDIAEIRTTVTDVNLTCIRVPASRYRYPRFFMEIARVMRLSARELAEATRMFGRIIAMTDEEVDEWNDHTVEDFIVQYTQHPGLISLFGFLLGLYFILPYWKVSAGEAFWAFRRMVRDNWLSYPVGGSQVIPGTYVDVARRRGGEVRTGTGVRRVLVDAGRVTGVELADGSRIDADIVVSTSSVRTTVQHLVGPEHFPAAYADAARSIEGSFIAVQCKVGLDTKLVDAGAIVGGVGEHVDLFTVGTDDIKAMFDNVAQGRVPPVIPFYCPVPSNFDPSLAPPGGQLLTCCAVAPTSDVDLVDPPEVWEEAMLRSLRAVVPGLDEHALFIDRFSVDFIERWIGKEFGPAVSTGQVPGQVGADRTPVHTPIDGLYLAGCGAGARGVGTELAAASAMECVDRVLTDLGRAPYAPIPEVGAGSRLEREATRALGWVARGRARLPGLRAGG